MGLFIFLIIMLAAAWGFIVQLNDLPRPPPHIPVARHAPPATPDQKATEESAPGGMAPLSEPSPSDPDPKSS